MPTHRLPRPVTRFDHPGGRGGTVQRPFGDPIAFPEDCPRFIAPPPTSTG
jgi:hypothetical protein